MKLTNFLATAALLGTAKSNPIEALRLREKSSSLLAQQDPASVSAALDLIQQAIILDPNAPRQHYIQGACQLSLETYPKAIRSFTTEIKINPDDAEVIPLSYYGRGISYIKLGHQEKGSKDFQTIINKYPKHAELLPIPQAKPTKDGSKKSFSDAIIDPLVISMSVVSLVAVAATCALRRNEIQRLEQEIEELEQQQIFVTDEPNIYRSDEEAEQSIRAFARNILSYHLELETHQIAPFLSTKLEAIEHVCNSIENLETADDIELVLTDPQHNWSEKVQEIFRNILLDNLKLREVTQVFPNNIPLTIEKNFIYDLALNENIDGVFKIDPARLKRYITTFNDEAGKEIVRTYHDLKHQAASEITDVNSDVTPSTKNLSIAGANSLTPNQQNINDATR